jgi:uncharacterized protein YndB with AHSA1/START domain
MKNLVLKKTIDINAPSSKVWDALTNPGTIKQWLYGTDTISDWKVGSPIIFTGTWQGTEYTDKGTILTYEAGKVLKYNYWSSFSGLPDSPENYSVIAFELIPKDKNTELKLTQTNFVDEKSCEQSDENWDATLGTMKKLIEK